MAFRGHPFLTDRFHATAYGARAISLTWWYEVAVPIKETLTAKPVALAEVLSNGKRYIVPAFQRDYAWDEGEWRELWEDLSLLHKSTDERANHYLGALVLQPTGEQMDSRIIDGQQRLVTLSLLALAVIKRLRHLVTTGVDTNDNSERIRLLQEKFVSTKDSASLQRRSRLRPNDQDNGFYETYLVQGLEPPKPATLKGSNAKRYRAYRFFEDRIIELLGAAAAGEVLARFLEHTVAQRLRFIEIDVADEDTAFTVFETLNARGVALGTADLLKNFVFATAHQGGAGDLDIARQWWEQIVALVPPEKVATFLFHRLSARVPDLREKRVFSEVKQFVPREQNVFQFLKDTKEAAEVYAALDDFHSDFWNESADARQWVRILDALRVDQYRSVALAGFSLFAERPDKFSRLLQLLVVISLRAQVARVNPGDLQRSYQSAASRIFKGELKSPAAIARALASATPSDDIFRTSFAELAFDPKGPRRKLVRYILIELEVAAGGQRIDFESSDATVEHILPENPALGWEDFSSQERTVFTQRLGNLTLLEYDLNKQLGSADYQTKRAAYPASKYQLTRAITSAEWTVAAIKARQARLANTAVSIWKVDAAADETLTTV